MPFCTKTFLFFFLFYHKNTDKSAFFYILLTFIFLYTSANLVKGEKQMNQITYSGPITLMTENETIKPLSSMISNIVMFKHEIRYCQSDNDILEILKKYTRGTEKWTCMTNVYRYVIFETRNFKNETVYLKVDRLCEETHLQNADTMALVQELDNRGYNVTLS